MNARTRTHAYAPQRQLQSRTLHKHQTFTSKQKLTTVRTQSLGSVANKSRSLRDLVRREPIAHSKTSIMCASSRSKENPERAPNGLPCTFRSFPRQFVGTANSIDACTMRKPCDCL